jgi:hypothetical protein
MFPLEDLRLTGSSVITTVRNLAPSDQCSTAGVWTKEIVHKTGKRIA